jgi:hypothetical protein
MVDQVLDGSVRGLTDPSLMLRMTKKSPASLNKLLIE